ncbi:NifU family protein [Oligoflexus tunisiensis]|uniref:NifU family protein n=1 Tax=Oligoflexus tunisiensis TaxID=708132 RepID=UPI00114C91AE|nr:NifU family protein [Oligoflexus tunisiensis]
MTTSLPAVTVDQETPGHWRALHEPSGRITEGSSEDEVLEAMKELLGMDPSGRSLEPLTSDRFEGLAQEIALYLEGPVSDMLALHSGYARLESFQNGIASVRLGGGCEGCPSSRLTLMNGVKRDLQDKFGEDVLLDVFPVLD